jgi:hypothetical protein
MDKILNLADTLKIQEGTDRLLDAVMKTSIPDNQVMRFCTAAFHKSAFELVDCFGKKDVAALSLNFERERYELTIERKPEIKLTCEHNLNPDTCQVCQYERDKIAAEDEAGRRTP